MPFKNSCNLSFSAEILKKWMQFCVRLRKYDWSRIKIFRSALRASLVRLHLSYRSHNSGSSYMKGCRPLGYRIRWQIRIGAEPKRGGTGRNRVKKHVLKTDLFYFHFGFLYVQAGARSARLVSAKRV